jgi:ATP-dependent exoDNAse (exonuclease V) beta subunit
MEGGKIMLEKGTSTSEFKAIIAGLSLMAAQVLGIDADSIILILQRPELKDVIEYMKQAHSNNDWTSNLAMWAGIGAFVWSRTSRKNKAMSEFPSVSK